MWFVVGCESKKVYSEGKTKAECMRKLSEKYPYTYSKKRKKQVLHVGLYPEKLKIKKGVDEQ